MPWPGLGVPGEVLDARQCGLLSNVLDVRDCVVLADVFDACEGGLLCDVLGVEVDAGVVLPLAGYVNCW